MKLIYKVCSPFFILILLFSCKDETFNEIQTDTTFLNKAYDLSIEGDKYYALKKYDTAFYFFTTSKILFVQEKDSMRAAYPLLMMSMIQRIAGDYSGSEATATESLPFLKHSDISYSREIYNILGSCYRKLYNYDESLKYYSKALEITQDSLVKCIIINNKASVYIDRSEYSSAISLLENILQSDTVQNHTETKARVLNNLGSAYTHLNDAKAIDFLREALHLREEINDVKGLFSSYYDTGVYYKDKNSKLSEQYAHKAYITAKELNNVEEQIASLKLLINVSQGVDFKLNTLKYVALQEDLDKTKAKAKNEFAKVKYDSKIVTEENTKLKETKAKNELQIQKDRTTVFVLSITIGFSIVVFMLLMYIRGLRHKKEKMAEAYKTETRIAVKIHDELANDILHIMTLAENTPIYDADNKEKLIDGLDSIYLRTRNISKENSSIETGNNFAFGLKSMLAEYNTENTNIVLALNNTESVLNDIDESKQVTIYRILQELMVNMKKHSNATLVVVKFIASGKELIINYVDNGKGFDMASTLKNGIKNAENRIFNIKGTITFDTACGSGVKVKLNVPL